MKIRLQLIKLAKLLLTVLCIGECVFIGVKTGSILKGIFAWILTWFIGCLITFGIILWKYFHGDTSFVEEASEELMKKFNMK